MMSLQPITGIRLGSCSAGIKNRPDIPDLAIIEISPHSAFSCVFTKNTFCAAPVIVARQHLATTIPRYLLINSGNANAGTGEPGIRNAVNCCRIVSELAGCKETEVIPFSTGVIGEELPVKAFQASIPTVLKDLRTDGWQAAADAIMTTDTTMKCISHQVSISNTVISITGIAKGSGMICPDMATMLAFIATDAAVSQVVLDECLLRSVNSTFNCITVDGDMSTNDACVLIATGAAGNTVISGADSEDFRVLSGAVEHVCMELAKMIIRDGEGATKFITIETNTGRSTDECRTIARKIANSPLVKTAFFASDPNWGRILAAVGSSGVEDLDIAGISIFLDDVCIVYNGERSEQYRESDGQKIMAQNEITIRVELGRGTASGRIWTCDLSYDYVKINAEYRT